MTLKALKLLVAGPGFLFFLTPQALTRRPVPSLSETDRVAIASVLSQQQAAWNRADATAFMQGYWNSPELTFAGSSGITRGWEPVLARYEHQYPDHAAMGRLEFSDLETRSLGPDAALVLGRWHLTRASGDLGGVFSLVFERLPEGWRIIHDHSSADAKPR